MIRTLTAAVAVTAAAILAPLSLTVAPLAEAAPCASIPSPWCVSSPDDGPRTGPIQARTGPREAKKSPRSAGNPSAR
ncbi:membrane protein [Mycobacterium Phage Niklas]|uniref:Membrane protein n=1 Tax=Mycobacterium Phage Niklas TaxID=2517936 RepID=A0A482JI01_9CAUD|nr:membrane protein [Mycobacterium Phage Niklas]QAY02809.1 hypothetical protein SEA_SHAOBING_78 [Mycobacterium phage Shaobing]QBP31661.1 membrane protein [Mycobacterium Phage Niklas]